jgi:TetR/AcrR family transcriptional regulator, transcriptional repressor for nem operon
MARTKEFDIEVAMNEAMELFWRKGYEATSVNDLLECMGINRGSLYDTFGDKHQLFIATLNRYRNREHTKLRQLASATESPMRFIELMFDDMIHQALTDPFRRGCFINNTIVELAPHDKLVCEVIAANDESLDDILIRVLSRAKEQGEISAEANISTMVNYLKSTIHGLRVTSKATPERTVLQSIVNGVLFTLKHHDFA